jgi:hypothetical protein
MNLRNRKKLLFIGVLNTTGHLTILGLYLCILVSSINHAKASTSWPEAPGVVTVAAVSEQAGVENKVGKIWYEYKLAGTIHRSDRVSFFEQDALYNYPKGTVVSVHYNPKYPKESCLVPGVTSGAIFSMYCGFALFAHGLLMVAIMLHRCFIAKLKDDGKLTGAEKCALATVVTNIS